MNIPDIVNAVMTEKPNMVFLYRCYHIFNSTIKIISKKTVLMSYNNDDPFSGVPSASYYRNHIANAKYCDINYVYRKKNIVDYSAININNTKVLLPYYLSWQNTPIDCNKDIQIAFIGHFEKDGRDIFIKKAIESGVPIQIYGGKLWEKSTVFNELSPYLHTPVSGAKYNELLNRVKILIVFFSKHNHDTYTRRCFEIPAVRGLMLSEYTEDMDSLYPENECAVYFRNHEEFVKKAKWLMNDYSSILRIAENSYKRVQELGASEIDRCQEVINDYKELKNYKQWK